MKKIKDAFHVDRHNQTLNFAQSGNICQFKDILKTDVTLAIAGKRHGASTALATAISSTGGALSVGMLVPDERVDVIVRVFLSNGECEKIVTTDKPVSRVCKDYFEYVRIARQLQAKIKELKETIIEEN